MGGPRRERGPVPSRHRAPEPHRLCQSGGSQGLRGHPGTESTEIGAGIVPVHLPFRPG